MSSNFVKIGKARHWGTLFVLLLFVSWADWVTTYEINVGPLYLLVVGYAAWHMGGFGGVVVSSLAAASWLITDLHSGNHYSQEWIRWQQFGVRIAVYFALVYALNLYRHTLEAHRRRVAALERVLVVCPACGMIGPREGGWIHAEELANESDERYKFCPECSATSKRDHASENSARS